MPKPDPHPDQVRGHPARHHGAPRLRAGRGAPPLRRPRELTLTLALTLALAQLTLTHLVSGGRARLLQGVAQEPLTTQALYAARELFLVAGDTHTHPITRLDGRVIGDGKVGPVCRALTAMLEEDAAADSADQHHPVCP